MTSPRKVATAAGEPLPLSDLPLLEGFGQPVELVGGRADDVVRRGYSGHRVLEATHRGDEAAEGRTARREVGVPVLPRVRLRSAAGHATTPVGRRITQSP